MAYIGKRPIDLIQGNASYDSFTGDGSTTAFDVSNILPDGGEFDVEVFVDNVRQEAGASKSYTIGNDGSGDRKRVTFNVAPDSGAEIYVINPGRETSLITVADNAVTTAKIQADAITGAKIADDAINSEHITDGSVDNVHLAGSIANSKLANSSITINGTAVSLGGSVTAGTDWQAVVVADGSTQLTAVAGKGYFLDTNLGVIEVLLPSSPSRGDTIILADYGGTFATNKVIVNAGSNLIDSVETQGLSQGYALTTNNLVVELVFVDTGKGWQIIENEAKSSLTASEDSNAKYIEATGGTVSTSGDYKIHTFTGDGNFVVSQLGNSSGGGPNAVDYLVVAGGGGGGSGYSSGGGGGGGGGFRYFASPTTNPQSGNPGSPLNSPAGITITATTFPITVGGGGTGAPVSAPTRDDGTPGSNSVFSTITSAGGGRGGVEGGTTAPHYTGENGGSGGGGGYSDPAQDGIGSGNTPPVSPPQGNNGGAFGGTPGCQRMGGGGGGAIQAGIPGDPPSPASTRGNGGNGAGVTGFGASNGQCSSCVQYFSGGGGAQDQGNPRGNPGDPAGTATGGLGGGGRGSSDGSPAPALRVAVAGTANTGGGAGANTPAPGTVVNGGKGIVVIRYKYQN